jgi:hypothetical protein
MICTKCKMPVEDIGGALVVSGTNTTADGLSYCPPDPDTTRKVGDHRTRKADRRG